MSRPDTAFDSPQFQLIPDSHARHYANVSNSLDFISEDGNVREFLVAVPTLLFTIMRDILKVDPVDEVTLYIEQQGEFYVFGAIWGAQGFTDLWTYSWNSLPPMFK